MPLKSHLRDTSKEGRCVNYAHQTHPLEAAFGSAVRYEDNPIRLLPLSSCSKGAHCYNSLQARPRQR